MNIFAPFNTWTKCAEFLDDRRLGKQILELAQLLSTCGYGPYKPTHINHPCTKWVKDNPVSAWSALYAFAAEFYDRFGHDHQSYLVIKEKMGNIACDFDVPQSLPNVTPYKNTPLHEAYQWVLRDKWISDNPKPKWTKE